MFKFGVEVNKENATIKVHDLSATSQKQFNDIIEGLEKEHGTKDITILTSADNIKIPSKHYHKKEVQESKEKIERLEKENELIGTRLDKSKKERSKSLSDKDDKILELEEEKELLKIKLNNSSGKKVAIIDYKDEKFVKNEEFMTNVMNAFKGK